MIQSNSDQKLSIANIKNIPDLKSSLNSKSINFKNYSFVTSVLLISLIYFVFTILFVFATGIGGVMVSYILQRYNLIIKILEFEIWSKVLLFGSIVFIVANYCLFEAEAIVVKLISSREQTSNNNELSSLLKIRPKNWQKIFYTFILFAFSLFLGYFFAINYIGWNYNQFWSINNLQ